MVVEAASLPGISSQYKTPVPVKVTNVQLGSPFILTGSVYEDSEALKRGEYHFIIGIT